MRKILVDELVVTDIEDQILLARKIHAILEGMDFSKGRLEIQIWEQEVKTCFGAGRKDAS